MRLWTIAIVASLMCSSPSARAVLWPSAVARVERELHAPDVDVRRRAAETLRDLPASVGVRLSQLALDDSDVAVRLIALDACRALAVRGVGLRLVPWLTDGEPRLRLAAAEALADDPTPGAVPSLARALGDADEKVRSAAAFALGRSGAPDASLALLGHLDDSVPQVRRDVALALGELGDPRAVTPLIGKIQDDQAAVREAAAQALAQLDDARAVSGLVLLLHDADDAVRVASLGALSRLGDPTSVPSIVAILPASVDRVRSAALSALSAIHSKAALKALLDELDEDEPGRPRSEVVQALGHAGNFAVPLLCACLGTESARGKLDGCALALGETHAQGAAVHLGEALKRGALRPLVALQAMTVLGAPESLLSALEYLSDADPPVRLAAIAAVRALLDPRHPDGRAVEPLSRALLAAHGRRAEQAGLLELLGRTGSPRAAPKLFPFAAAGEDVEIRALALTSLGFLGEAGQVPTLLTALDDDSGGVRLAAALALGRLPLVGYSTEMLVRLKQSSVQEQPLITLALGNMAAHARDPAVVMQLEKMLADARYAARDSLLQLLGRVPLREAVVAMARVVVASGLVEDRAKFAEALAAHANERERLVPLLTDESPVVRANAAWSLGEVGTAADVGPLVHALDDVDASVAGNALEALSRVSRRAHLPIAARACPFVSSPRAILRALSLRALRFSGERCEHRDARRVLSLDRSDFARQSAALLIRAVPEDERDRRALAHAIDHDLSGAVAAACESAPPPAPVGTDATTIAVIPPGADLPSPAQPFALLRADGLVRLGVSDRRGQVFEVAAPHGELSLIESAFTIE